MNFAYLDKLKSVLDQHRPLPAEVVTNLHQNMVLHWTYNSNAIEGNTLTLIETKVALEGVAVGGKTLREHFEVINHREAIFFMEGLAAKNTSLTEWDIKSIHGLILKNVDTENAGRYRRVNVLIQGAKHRPVEALRVQEEMERFILQLTSQNSIHPVERAARLHCDFVKIHPFVDGNGRTARLLMNLELLKSGFPVAVFPVGRRLEYYQALDAAHCTDDYSAFLKLVSEVVEEAFDPFWWALGLTKPEPS
jgi:Fic family protein